MGIDSLYPSIDVRRNQHQELPIVSPELQIEFPLCQGLKSGVQIQFPAPPDMQPRPRKRCKAVGGFNQLLWSHGGIQERFE